MVEKFLEQTTFTSQEDFIKNLLKSLKILILVMI